MAATESRGGRGGYLYVMGRIDDVIIVAGHNLSSGSIEEVLASHRDVAECAVFGVKDALKTQIPLALVVLKATVQREHATIKRELLELVMRSTLRKIANAESFQIPATIEDPGVLTDIRAVLRELGYASV